MAKIKPQLSDMFACQTCTTQIQVMKACECDSPCTEFSCCGKPMKNNTEPAVRKAGDQSVGDGLEIQSQDNSPDLPQPSMADQAEQAKKI